MCVVTLVGAIVTNLITHRECCSTPTPCSDRRSSGSFLRPSRTLLADRGYFLSSMEARRLDCLSYWILFGASKI